MRSAIARIATRTDGATVNPSCAARRAAHLHPRRVVAEGVLRASRRVQHPTDQVTQAAIWIDELPGWQPVPPSH